MLPMASTIDWETCAVICLVSAISLARMSKLLFFIFLAGLGVVCSALLSSSEVHSQSQSHAFGCQTHSPNSHLVVEVRRMNR